MLPVLYLEELLHGRTNTNTAEHSILLFWVDKGMPPVTLAVKERSPVLSLKLHGHIRAANPAELSEVLPQMWQLCSVQLLIPAILSPTTCIWGKTEKTSHLMILTFRVEGEVLNTCLVIKKYDNIREDRNSVFANCCSPLGMNRRGSDLSCRQNTDLSATKWPS